MVDRDGQAPSSEPKFVRKVSTFFVFGNLDLENVNQCFPNAGFSQSTLQNHSKWNWQKNKTHDVFKDVRAARSAFWPPCTIPRRFMILFTVPLILLASVSVIRAMFAIRTRLDVAESPSV